MFIKNRLRELRESKKYTQLKVALDLNLNQNSISRYESGSREAESPEAWVREHGRWPIISIANVGSDTVITTGDCAGNIIRYTFSE